VITEDEISLALDWLVKNAGPASKARAEREYLTEYRKSKKAILMSQSDAKTVSERETYAYGHPEYLEVLEGYRAAVEADEKFRWLQVAADTKIQVWRSENANNRIQAKVG